MVRIETREDVVNVGLIYVGIMAWFIITLQFAITVVIAHRRYSELLWLYIGIIGATIVMCILLQIVKGNYEIQKNEGKLRFS